MEPILHIFSSISRSGNWWLVPIINFFIILVIILVVSFVMSVQHMLQSGGGPKAAGAAAGLAALVAVVGILAAVAIPNFLQARDRAKFSMCAQSLSGVKTALEMYLTDNGSLEGMDPYGDAICNELLPGYEDPSGCKGLVKKRIESSCKPETFNISVNESEFQYEVTAGALTKKPCGICVTEIGYFPASVRECTPDAASACQH